MNAIFIDKSCKFVIICPSTKHPFKVTIVVCFVVCFVVVSFVAMLLLWGGFMIPLLGLSLATEVTI